MDKEFLESLMEMPEAVVEAILAQHGKAVEALEGKYRAAMLDGAVGKAIALAGGRNEKAIAALLDMQALQGAENLDAAAGEAVRAVKENCGYLFQVAPAFAPGTGGVQMAEKDAPVSLAQALREKFRL